MCGIFGITSQCDVAPTLVEGLERLEYRGYDSCGIAVLGEDSQLALRKGAGEVAIVKKEERFHELSGHSGLGHTRWATHGRVSGVNAHPHFSGDQKIAIVHNGILENHESLRRELEGKGCTFLSETDSEVIAHLIETEYAAKQDFEAAILATIGRLEGTYAMGVISSHCPGTLYAARQESPLILGIGPDFRCFASDPLAFSELSSEVVYLEDGELACIEPAGYRIHRIAEQVDIQRASIKLQLDSGRVDLGDHPDYMSKEIAENSVVTRTALEISEEDIESFVDAIENNSTTYLTGMGTAYYVVLMAQYAFARFGGKFLPVVTADELPYLVHFSDSDHIIAVSQSGETYDTLRALRLAKQAGATTSAVLNVPSSSMAREVDRCIDQKAGPEICVLSTKATISQLVILFRVALRLGERTGFLSEADVVSAREELRRLPALFERSWERPHDHVRELARRFSVIRNWFFLGRGIYYGLAMEGALKFKEVTYCHAEGMPAGFLKHGTISLIDEAMHSAVFLPSLEEEELRNQTMGAVAEIDARAGAVVAFQREGIGDPEKQFAALIEYPGNGPLTDPLLALMQAQIFAYYSARALGRNVDKPRALAKSVTVG